MTLIAITQPPRRRTGRWAPIALAALSLGCGSVSLPRTMWNIPVGDPQSFDSVAGELRSSGYTISAADPLSGTLTIPAHARDRGGDAAVFTVQFYRDGFFELIPNGTRIERTEHGYSMSRAVGQEYRSLATGLTAAHSAVAGSR